LEYNFFWSGSARMEKLPPNSREVLILRELEGMSYREIADITGMRWVP
jgi:DNA-directed RNA polymerase specialized sigma24 family protein